MTFDTGSAPGGTYGYGGGAAGGYGGAAGAGAGGGGQVSSMFSALMADPTIASMFELKKKKGAEELERSKQERALARERADIERAEAGERITSGRESRAAAKRAEKLAETERQRTISEERAAQQAYAKKRMNQARGYMAIPSTRDAAESAAADWYAQKYGKAY
jgi:hypothetical protein